MAPTPPPAAGTPTSAAAPSSPAPTTIIPTLNPDATPLELAGTVASTLPGTPLRPGQPVSSVVDQSTKRRDLYAVPLRAGQAVTVLVTATSNRFEVLLGPPGQRPLDDPATTTTLCSLPAGACHRHRPVATTDTYPLAVVAEGPALRYTLVATAQ